MIHEHPSSEKLIDYVHGELSPREDAAVHAHLAGCAGCSEAHADEVRLGELLREQARAEERELPPGFAARIVATATSAPAPARWWRPATLFRPAFALPAAAMLAIALYLSFAVFNNGPAKTTTVDASYYIESHAALATDMPFAENASLPMSFASYDSAPPQGNDGR
ncbi:MAG: zf-HC2 domain-containing protein [Candidatus Eremiobacteraeota bacterium]|nr:zf-HC2 domain-containing protein [Candidatus Eremiobacteraeota bacterium]